MLGEKTECLTADLNDSEGRAVAVGADNSRIGGGVQTGKDEVSMEEQSRRE